MVVPANPVAWDVAPFATERVDLRQKGAKYFQLLDNEFVGIFGTHFHYESAPGVWEETDRNFVPFGPDHIMERAFFHVRVTGAGVEINDPETGFGVRWLTPTRPTVANNKAQFNRDGLSWEYEVVPRGVKLAATVNAVRGPHTYIFTYQLLGGANDFTIDAEGNAQGDGFVVRKAHIEGADGSIYDAGPWRPEPGPRLSFDFDDSVLPPEAFPYVIDPTTDFDVSTGAHDGMTSGFDASYPPPVDFSSSTGSEISCERTKSGGNFVTENMHMRWDTSSLADNAVLSKADLRILVISVNDFNSRNLTFDWNDAVTVGQEDHEDFALNDALTGKDISTLSVPNLFNTLTLDNEDEVSLTGFTGLRGHISGGEPTLGNKVRVRPFEAASQPRLSITFTVPLPNITGVSPSSGVVAGGTSVTITGTGLLSASSVTFGGTEVTSIDSNTDIEIVVTTASHAAGLVDVIVTTPEGSNTEVGAYTYIALPVITGVDPILGSIDGGTSVTITGTGLAGATSVKFGGTEVTSIDSNNDTTIVVTTAAHASGVVDVVVVNPGGTDTEVGGFTYAVIGGAHTGGLLQQQYQMMLGI